jgi:mRNA interferase MazF
MAEGARVARGIAWGDIRLVDLGPRAGTRPALILTRTAVLPWLNAVTLAPVTRTVRGVRTELSLGVDEGLKGRSVAQLDAIQTVPVGIVGRFVGSLASSRKRELAEALLYAFELLDQGDH